MSKFLLIISLIFVCCNNSFADDEEHSSVQFKFNDPHHTYNENGLLETKEEQFRRSIIEAQEGDFSLLMEFVNREVSVKELRILISYVISDLNSNDIYEIFNLVLQVAEKYDVIKFALAVGANIETKGVFEYTPLLNAVSRNDIKIVEYLLYNGANINAKDAAGNSVLHLSVINKDIKILKLLIETHGVNVNLKNINGDTPLHEAVNFQRVMSVQLLMMNNANVDARNKEGETALHFAARKGDVEVSKYLIENYGADLYEKNKKKETPGDLAVKSKQVKLVKFYMQAYGYRYKAKQFKVFDEKTRKELELISAKVRQRDRNSSAERVDQEVSGIEAETSRRKSKRRKTEKNKTEYRVRIRK